ncbi:proline-rich 33 kDa extensin-related protein-like [Penaeus japonicus]|uniref:proline-rich 33 kDa extensin-related protein-like n=1 Tax=Penaeus japonicus TaxID=27405 RepID=UPI001C7113F5|nr:proline-rich 33 kDa extensin-related protein-like [Penaeus japonicus]
MAPPMHVPLVTAPPMCGPLQATPLVHEPLSVAPPVHTFLLGAPSVHVLLPATPLVHMPPLVTPPVHGPLPLIPPSEGECSDFAGSMNKAASPVSHSPGVLSAPVHSVGESTTVTGLRANGRSLQEEHQSSVAPPTNVLLGVSELPSSLSQDSSFRARPRERTDIPLYCPLGVLFLPQSFIQRSLLQLT